jgi:glycerophosphoryl diester phosphodiesterase
MRTKIVLSTLGLASAVALAIPVASAGSTVSGAKSLVKEPIVIGHRGASGYRPEHTLASYETAIAMGADYVEPDLVSTKDGVLVARHENEIATTTDVATHPEFASRKATKTIDGVSVTGWFTEDFTLAELKTLRAIERLPAIRPQNTIYNGQFQIPTLQEVIDLAAQVNAGRQPKDQVGIYPETKHPSYFDSIGLSLEEPLVATLNANGYDAKNSLVFIQSFEVANLKQLRTMTKVPLVQLADATGKPYDFVVAGDPRTYADLVTADGLREIATYADGVGVNKNLIIPRDAANKLLAPTDVVADAHQAHLLVHIWTMRNENTFLPADFQVGTDPAHRGQPEQEDALFLSQGIDGFFTDNADTGVGALAAFLASR